MPKITSLNTFYPMKFETIYSLGSRCQNSEILKHYGFREFSGFFDFMNTAKIENILHILKDDFKELLKPENNFSIICNQTTYEPETGIPLHSSVRTSNKYYNEDYTGVHSAIFPHHDLNSEKDRKHFETCYKRFKNLINFNVLFNYTFNSWENNITTKDMETMVETMINVHGFKTFKICFIRLKFGNNNEYKLIHDEEKYNLWELTISPNSFTGGRFLNTKDNENYIEIIKNNGICDSRITKEKIDDYE